MATFVTRETSHQTLAPALSLSLSQFPFVPNEGASPFSLSCFSSGSGRSYVFIERAREDTRRRAESCSSPRSAAAAVAANERHDKKWSALMDSNDVDRNGEKQTSFNRPIYSPWVPPLHLSLSRKWQLAFARCIYVYQSALHGCTPWRTSRQRAPPPLAFTQSKVTEFSSLTRAKLRVSY